MLVIIEKRPYRVKRKIVHQLTAQYPVRAWLPPNAHPNFHSTAFRENFGYRQRYTQFKKYFSLIKSRISKHLYTYINLNIMRNKLSFLFLKWWHTLLIALVFAIAYIIVDDNNIVSDKVQTLFYIIFWLSVLITIILVIKRKR